MDIGTSSVKTVLVTADGQLVAKAALEHPMHRPRPGWAENDPEDWYRGVVQTVRRVAELAGADSERIAGLAIVAQRDPVILLGDDGVPVTRTMSWTDRRTQGECADVCSLLGRDYLIETTGVVPMAGLSLMQLLWVKRHQPQVWSSVRRVSFVKDYVLERLTGLAGTDVSMPARSVMNDIAAGGWSGDICEACGIDVGLLPAIERRPWEVLETLSASAADTLGLPAELPLAVGGADDPSAALGAGAIDAGDSCAGTGTASDWRTVVERGRPQAGLGGDVAAHVIPDRDIFEVTIDSTGSSLRWLRDLLAPAAGGTYDFVQLAADVPAGAGGLFFYPYVDGAERAPRYHPTATGVFFGVASGHTRGHMVRALLEGVAFQYPPTLGVVERTHPVSSPLILVDGEARSQLWNQIKADVLGRPIRVPRVVEAAALGAAMLAGMAAGVFRDPRAAVDGLLRWERTYEPDPEQHETYRALATEYERVYEHIQGAYPDRAPTETEELHKA